MISEAAHRRRMESRRTDGPRAALRRFWPCCRAIAPVCQDRSAPTMPWCPAGQIMPRRDSGRQVRGPPWAVAGDAARFHDPAGSRRRAVAARSGRAAGRLSNGSGGSRAATARPGPLLPEGLRRHPTGRGPGLIAHPVRPRFRPSGMVALGRRPGSERRSHALHTSRPRSHVGGGSVPRPCRVGCGQVGSDGVGGRSRLLQKTGPTRSGRGSGPKRPDPSP
jgi:hypothetical protein